MSKNTTLLFITFTSSVFLGCSSVTGVTRIDTNQYYISNSDSVIFISNETIIDDAHAKAAKYCKRKDKKHETVSLDTEGFNSHDLGHVRLHFKCVEK